MMHGAENLEPIPLSILNPGEFGVLHTVGGGAELVRHLAEIGLQVGTVIEMVRSGDPCILRIEGGRFAVRCNELLTVLVTPIAAARHSA